MAQASAIESNSHLSLNPPTNPLPSATSAPTTSNPSNGPIKSSANHQGSNTSIPMNKDSKIYDLPEVFDVWDANKQLYLNANANSDSTPDPIHHLLFKSQEVKPEPISDQLSGLDINSSEDVKNVPPVSQPESPALLSPENIQWYYLDSSGNEQGPFNGTLMQSWFSEGYLNLDLQLKTLGSNYFPLKQFCQSVNNFLNPFTVPLPASGLNLQPVQNDMNSLLNPVMTQPLFNDPIGHSSFGQQIYSPLQMNNSVNPINSLLQQQIQKPNLPRTNSGWGVGDYSSPSTTPITVNTGISQPLSQPLSASIQHPIPSSIQQQSQVATPGSPWSSAMHSQSRVSSPFVPESNSNVLPDIHSSVVTGVLGDFQAPLSSDPASETVTSPDAISQPRVVVPADIVPQPEPQSIEHPIERPTVQESTQVIGQPKVVVPEPIPAKSEPESIQQPKVALSDEQTAPKKKLIVEEEDPLDKLRPKVESLKPSTLTSNNKAPWAAKESSEKPKLTLKEIQQLENEKYLQQKKLEQELKLENQAKILLEEQEKDREEQPYFPSTSTWGNTTTNPVKLNKTLAEIQEEERKASELAKTKSKNVGPSLASTLSSTPAADGDAWSTVTNKKPNKKVSNSNLASKPVSFSAAAAGNGSSNRNPQALRSVSANNVTGGTSDTSNKAREDLIIWARSQMNNLYPSVSPNDLLEMFVTLPLNSQDSSQLISETIYSSSTTMNGRVFAQDFMKKRQQVERQLKGSSDDMTAWSLAIAQTVDKVPTVDEEGWSTSTKPKKKGRKN